MSNGGTAVAARLIHALEDVLHPALLAQFAEVVAQLARHNRRRRPAHFVRERPKKLPLLPQFVKTCGTNPQKYRL